MSTSANPSPAEIVAALQRGGIVGALKVVLAAKGVGSSRVKDVPGQAGSPPKPFKLAARSSNATDLSPGEVPRSNGDIWLVLFLVAALCATYYFFAR